MSCSTPFFSAETLDGRPGRKKAQQRLTEVCDVFNVARNVVGRAGGCESTWQRHQHDLLAGELLVGVVGDGKTTDFGVGGGPCNVFELDW